VSVLRGLDALLAGTEAADELGARLKVEKELRDRTRCSRAAGPQGIPQTREIVRKLLVGVWSAGRASVSATASLGPPGGASAFNENGDPGGVRSL